MGNDLPKFVSRITNEKFYSHDYVSWLNEIKQLFRSSQAKAAVKVNEALLEFYWYLGRDIVAMHVNTNWGSSFFDNLSLDLRAEFPEQKGFSVSNLKYIKRWYQFYYDRLSIRQNRFDEIDDSILRQFGQNDFDELDMPRFFALIPWGHHIEIITKCNTLKEAMFYANETIKHNWRGKDLKDKIKQDYFASLGNIPNNFKELLPEKQAQAIQSILKDPYRFDFLRLREKYSEADLEEALINNISRFLLELGRGFAFVGRQMELRMEDGTSYFPDLIFYHTKLHAYVVIELKVVDFMPEFVGKLNFYVNAANHLLKDNADNPTIGLVICKSANKTKVEWSFKGIKTPIGVATYELQAVVDRTFNELTNSED